MTYARPSKSLRDMTAAERAAHYAAVDRDMEVVAAELVVSHRRNNLPTECSIPDYLRWGRQRKQCMLLVRHEPSSLKGAWVSRDGDEHGKKFFLPDSQRELRPQSSGQFILVMVSNFIRSKMPADFSGVTPHLSGEWSVEDRDLWADLRSICRKINYEIQATPRRLKSPRRRSSITHTISPSNAA